MNLRLKIIAVLAVVPCVAFSVSVAIATPASCAPDCTIEETPVDADEGSCGAMYPYFWFCGACYYCVY